MPTGCGVLCLKYLCNTRLKPAGVSVYSKRTIDARLLAVRQASGQTPRPS